jgi:starch synthase (maltosyl-transferring)
MATRASAERKAAERKPSTRGLEYIAIECVAPELDGGRFPVKRIVGDVVEVAADIFKEGHDLLAGRLLFRGPGDVEWRMAPLVFDHDTDRWYAAFTVDRIGRWSFTLEAWTDVFGSWRSGLRKKVDAAQEVKLELLEGAAMIRQAVRRAKFGPDRAALLQIASTLDDEFATLMAEYLPPRDLTRYRRELGITVDRERAGFAAWYEFFPRSNGATGRHGTFETAAQQLPRIVDLGFDVVYLPPIHPIGRTFRKGKNNALTPAADDVGSPWAIGNESGGHTAVAPELGTIDDFDRFVKRANAMGLEVALDYALQCSPDHPWVKEHPDWFHIRPDGSIAYAENPPKKYQDIYPLNFWCEDRENLWQACRDIFLFWIEHGVKTFRVDNPHTKPFLFWEWCIDEVQRQYPDVIFFSEAFTRPKRMKHLAKLGFTMSYTYFTWKNRAYDLREYLENLAQGPAAEYYRGNLFTNTPDILNEYLVRGGRPAFRVRLLLAGTVLPLYGIYSGFELTENVPVRAGSEEYLDSEKYQLRWRNFDAPGNINDDVRRLNQIRRIEPALQAYRNLTFHDAEDPDVLFYRKAAPGATAADRARHTLIERVMRNDPKLLDASTSTARAGTQRANGGAPVEPPFPPVLLAPPTPRGHDLLIVVNLDPQRTIETMVHVPIGDMGIADDEPYVVHDLLTDAKYTWRGRRNYVRLDPRVQVGHVLRVER